MPGRWPNGAPGQQVHGGGRAPVPGRTQPPGTDSGHPLTLRKLFYRLRCVCVALWRITTNKLKSNNKILAISESTDRLAFPFLPFSSGVPLAAGLQNRIRNL